MPGSRIRVPPSPPVSYLSKVDARFALIGGLALASHKVIRATQDIDLALVATVGCEVSSRGDDQSTSQGEHHRDGKEVGG
jgi:hypothetical protein